MSNHKPVSPRFKTGQVVMWRAYSQKFPLPQPQLCIILEVQSYASGHLSPGRQHNYRVRTYGPTPRETWFVDESLMSHFTEE